MNCTIYTGVRFHTMDPDRPVSTAMGVVGDRIAVTGSLDECRAALGESCPVVDVPGTVAVPGFVDCHVHFGEFAMRFNTLDVWGMGYEDVLNEVKQAAAKRPRGRWITGGGWDKNVWGLGDFPSKEALDAVAPDHPVALMSKDGHSMWVNSCALAAAGLCSESADPPGGEILRKLGSREPSGILRENAIKLVQAVIPKPTQKELAEALRTAEKLANSLGITSIHVPEGPDVFGAIQLLRSSGELTLRVYMMLPGDYLDDMVQLGLRTGFGDEMIRLGPIKLFADGSLGSQTAFMLEPYEDSESFGVQVLTKDEMVKIIRRASNCGIAVAMHAIGDAANRNALDAFESALEFTRQWKLRHRIEHAQIVHPEDLPRFHKLSLIASVQPIHATADRYIADLYWGARAKYAYPFRSLLSTGAKVCFGSDAPVESMDPLKGIYAAVTRKRETEHESEPWYADELVTVYDAVYAYTAGAAYASGEEETKGVLRPGMLADFVSLSHDIFEAEPEVLREARVNMTVLGGQVVWTRPDL
ncbi:MAG: amidohydrolase [Bacillota bacterium]